MHQIDRWLQEKRAAYLYSIVADMERRNAREPVFRELARAAEKQAILSQRTVEQAGGSVPETYRPDWRARLVARLVRRFGPRPLLGVLTAMKVRGMSLYGMTDPGHPMPLSLSEVERQHKGVGSGGNLRAAVFGINDGLVSNVSLILGLAGANAEHGVIVLTGFAGLLAGAFAMAAGEYVSVRSQREMYEYQIGLEKNELEIYPAEEAAELALIYRDRGLAREDAERMATTIVGNPEKALLTLVREELGLNANELGSPWGAALSSLLSFTAGAIVPLLPFLFGSHRWNLPMAIALTSLALFGVGAILSLFTGRSAVRNGLRMLGIGAVAGLATYLIGSLFGVSLG